MWHNVVCDKTGAFVITDCTKRSPREASSSLASQEFPCILWNPAVLYRFTAFRRDHHLTLPCARSSQFEPCHLISWRCILILYFCLPLARASGLCCLAFPTKTLYASFFPCACHTPRPPLSPWSDLKNHILKYMFYELGLLSWREDGRMAQEVVGIQCPT